MAERKPPGFTIPLAFYDGPEVKSIPKRIRTAAVGVWSLAGNYSASKLQDGYVDAETLKNLGCSDVIRAALMSTRGHDGKPDPLWIDAGDGGILFAKWDKWQRSRAEVAAYRDAEAGRKREARKRAKANSYALANEQLSNSYDVATPQLNGSDGIAIADESTGPAETAKRPGGRPTDAVPPKTETETETYTYGSVSHSSLRELDEQPEQRGQERGRSDPVDVSASRLVATLIPSNTPAAVKTSLRLAASQLIRGDGLSAEVVAESLRRWQARPDAGPGLLAHIASGVQREATAPAGSSKLRDWAQLAREVRAAENGTTTTGAIEP